MNDLPKRRFPFWLTLSVLANLVLLGLIAGLFLRAKPGPDHRRGPSPPGLELSREDRAAVRQLMRASFEAGRDEMAARREAERSLAAVLAAEPYDAAAARAAFGQLRDADRRTRDAITEGIVEGLDELTPQQRQLVAKIMHGNLERRGEGGGRLERFRERRGGPGEGPPPD
jgi:uncharacterized membrane protein